MRAASRRAAALLVACASLGGLAGTASAQERQTPKVLNFNAPGNLESTADLGCIALKDATNRHNPADLFRASGACVTAHRPEDAARLFALAGAYGRFDMLRVADRTAHQAILAIRSEIFGELPEADTEALTAALQKIMGDAALKQALCADVARIGAPTYAPRYMIQHGMGAFTGSQGDGLIEKFDAASAWNTVLTSYMKCAEK
jgi:hypothetical protein